MKIDRHNYEEYFLLYIDNELNVEQKKQIELFISENPDLEEELAMLQQSRLIPDNTIVFDKKHLLMQEENDSFINLNNYEELLVLYVDDELNEEERKAIEKFAGVHPNVLQELALFQQTKLQREKIVFADKEVLYRNERVTFISMQWWKVAVAAILIIAAGITLYSILSNGNNNGEITPNDVAGIKKEQTPDSSKLPMKQKQPPTIINEKEGQMVVSTPLNKEPTKKTRNQEQYLQHEQENNQYLALNVTGKNQTGMRQRVISKINDIKTNKPEINNAVAINDKMYKENFNNETVTPGPLQPPKPKEIADNNKNKKLRGFFRKATRIIERTTNINPADDDNKVLIGGMAINLK